MVSAIGKWIVSGVRVDSPLVRINSVALGCLKDGSLNGLFWSTLVTGSLGMAVSVVLFSYTSNVFKQLFLNGSMVR